MITLPSVRRILATTKMSVTSQKRALQKRTAHFLLKSNFQFNRLEYLRRVQIQTRLLNLGILVTESEITVNIDFEKGIILTLAIRKCKNEERN